MAKNAVQAGNTLTFTPVPAGGVLSGELIKIGVAIGVAQTDAPEGGAVEADVVGVFSLPAVSGQSFNFGQRVYLIEATGEVTGTASTNTLIGYCARPAAADKR